MVFEFNFVLTSVAGAECDMPRSVSRRRPGERVPGSLSVEATKTPFYGVSKVMIDWS